MTPLEFSLVRFTPSPEDIEAVNVAIMVWGARPRLIALEEGFPRLGAITNRFDERSLKVVLNDLRSRFEEQGNEALIGLTPQIQVQPAQKLYIPMSSEIESALKLRYLMNAKVSRHRRSPRARTVIESALDGFLLKGMKIPKTAIANRQKPGAFLPAEVVERYFPVPGISFSRVIVGRRDVLLIDSIHRALPISAVEHHATDVGAAFLAAGKAANELSEKYECEVHRTLVLFGETPEKSRSRMPWIEESLGRESDHIEDGERPSAALTEAVHRAVPALLV